MLPIKSFFISYFLSHILSSFVLNFNHQFQLLYILQRKYFKSSFFLQNEVIRGNKTSLICRITFFAESFTFKKKKKENCVFNYYM